MARSFQNAHYRVEVLDDPRVVRLVRTTEELHSVIEMVGVLDDIFQAVQDVDGATYGLIVDNRSGPTSADPAFQSAFKLFRERLDSRFVRVGVLVSAESSVQQMKELGVPDNVRVHTEEAAALRWAAEGRETVRPSS
jgi:hypothetical protein